MNLEIILWIAAGLTINIFSLLIGYAIASSKTRADTMRYVNRALELVIERAKAIEVKNDYIYKNLREVNERLDKFNAEIENKQ